MAVGNFTTVDGQARSQIAKFNIGNAPTSPTRATPTPTRRCQQLVDQPLHRRRAPAKFDTYMSDVEYSPDGSYFVVSTTGAYGGSAEQHRHRGLRRRGPVREQLHRNLARHLDGVHRR